MNKDLNRNYPCTKTTNTRVGSQDNHKGSETQSDDFQKARFTSEMRNSSQPLSLRKYLHQKLPRKHASSKLLQSIRNKIDKGEY